MSKFSVTVGNNKEQTLKCVFDYNKNYVPKLEK